MEGSAWVHDAKLSVSHRAPLSCVDWTNKKPETLLWHRRTVNQVKDRTVRTLPNIPAVHPCQQPLPYPSFRHLPNHDHPPPPHPGHFLDPKWRLCGAGLRLTNIRPVWVSSEIGDHGRGGDAPSEEAGLGSHQNVIGCLVEELLQGDTEWLLSWRRDISWRA